PRPMVGSATRFHPDKTGRAVREELKEFRPLDCLIHDPAGFPMETLINEPVVRITDEAGCNFQIDVGI
ncbi:hypothetical protein SB380_38775, partial [Burkholderia cenocepacia]|uniref:hypothetical protein n=1 Tax=Burkholderia cenocepacia TaxID=95486 RepID=UPI002B24D43B